MSRTFIPSVPLPIQPDNRVDDDRSGNEHSQFIQPVRSIHGTNSVLGYFLYKRRREHIFLGYISEMRTYTVIYIRNKYQYPRATNFM